MATIPTSVFLGATSLAFCLGSGCGAGLGGLVAVVSGSSSGSGDVNSPPVLDGVLIFSVKTSPAVIQFDLRDSEADSADVQIAFLIPGDLVPRPATLVSGVFAFDLDEESCEVDCEGNLVCDSEVPRVAADSGLDELGASAVGVTHFKLWDFAADGLGPGSVEDVAVFFDVNRTLGQPVSRSSTGPFLVDVGNDPPQIKPLELGVDLRVPFSGIAFVPLTLADSSADELAVKIEFRKVGDPACPDWQLAHPAALDSPDDETPCFAVDTTPNQGDLSQEDLEREDFFWATDRAPSTPDSGCDLRGIVAMVQLRVTAVETLDNLDDIGLRDVFVTDPFEVDNRGSVPLVVGSGLVLRPSPVGAPLMGRRVPPTISAARAIRRNRFAGGFLFELPPSGFPRSLPWVLLPGFDDIDGNGLPDFVFVIDARFDADPEGEALVFLQLRPGLFWRVRSAAESGGVRRYLLRRFLAMRAIPSWNCQESSPSERSARSLRSR